MLKNIKMKKNYRVFVQGLPLAGLLLGSLFPMTTTGHQLLILAALIWFQAYFIFDIFLHGK